MAKVTKKIIETFTIEDLLFGNPFPKRKDYREGFQKESGEYKIHPVERFLPNIGVPYQCIVKVVEYPNGKKIGHAELGPDAIVNKDNIRDSIPPVTVTFEQGKHTLFAYHPETGKAITPFPRWKYFFNSEPKIGQTYTLDLIDEGNKYYGIPTMAGIQVSATGTALAIKAELSRNLMLYDLEHVIDADGTYQHFKNILHLEDDFTAEIVKQSFNKLSKNCNPNNLKTSATMRAFMERKAPVLQLARAMAYTRLGIENDGINVLVSHFGSTTEIIQTILNGEIHKEPDNTETEQTTPVLKKKTTLNDRQVKVQQIADEIRKNAASLKNVENPLKTAFDTWIAQSSEDHDAFLYRQVAKELGDVKYYEHKIPVIA